MMRSIVRAMTVVVTFGCNAMTASAESENACFELAGEFESKSPYYVRIYVKDVVTGRMMLAYTKSHNSVEAARADGIQKVRIYKGIGIKAIAQISSDAGVSP